MKVLNKDFMNQKLAKSVLRLNKPTYLSISNFSIQDFKKYIKIYKKFSKDLRIIYTCFEKAVNPFLESLIKLCKH